MVAPVQKDSLTEWQQGLATYLRISSPIAGMFTGSEIKQVRGQANLPFGEAVLLDRSDHLHPLLSGVVCWTIQQHYSHASREKL